MIPSATGKPQTVKDLIHKLLECDQNLPAYLFAEGEDYPACIVQNITDLDGTVVAVEIGGGWKSVEWGPGF